MEIVRVFSEIRVGFQSLMFCPELNKPTVVVSKGTLDGGRAVRGVVEQCSYFLNKVAVSL